MVKIVDIFYGTKFRTKIETISGYMQIKLVFSEYERDTRALTMTTFFEIEEHSKLHGQ